MRCERCLLQDPASAQLPLEVFTERLTACDDCELLGAESGSLPLRTLIGKQREAARALRKLELASRKWENRCQELTAERERYEERVSILESMQKASTQEVEAELRAKIEIVELQRLAILAMSAPILQVGEGVLALPVIGTINADRAALMMSRLLEQIHATRSRVAIIDLTGVEEIDTVTVDHILRLFGAVRLLGAEIIVTGVHNKVAQSMVGLGLDLTTIRAMRDLREALGVCRAAGR